MVKISKIISNSLLKALSIASVLFMTSTLIGCGKKDGQDVNHGNVGRQLNMPVKGEEIAVVNTTMGSFKIRFFPESAPKAVENFKALSAKGYYNEDIFHRVIKDFMIQSGDPRGDGTGGESVWGKDFEDEFASDLLNITGSVSMANRGPNTNGSQFFINYQSPSRFPGWDRFQQTYDAYNKSSSKSKNELSPTVDMSKVDNNVKKLYEENGGNPNLDGYYNTSNKGHSVFAHVFEGLDVVEKISNVDTDDNDKPKESVRIIDISVQTYS